MLPSLAPAPRRKNRSPWAPLLLAAALGAGGLSCRTSSHGNNVGPSSLVATCSTPVTTVVAGSSGLVTVTVRLARGTVPAADQPVVFTTNLGDVAPDVVTTNADGTASTSFSPGSVAGTAIITATASTPGDQAVTACTISVTTQTAPRVGVTVVSPAQLAGLTVVVTYDSTSLSLSPSGVFPEGNLASSGAGCYSTERLDPGSATLILACPILETVGGQEVASLTFSNSGAPRTLSDFSVACTGVDETGTPVPTSCALSLSSP